MALDGMPSHVVDSDAPTQRKGRDHMATRSVKGTIDIPEDIVVHNHDILGHVLEVLLHQWGLAAVEVRIRANDGAASGVINRNMQQRLEVAGHSFPLALADY